MDWAKPRRILLVLPALACAIGIALIVVDFSRTPENIQDAHRLLAPYRTVDRKVIPGGGPTGPIELTHLERPAYMDEEYDRMVRALPSAHGWTITPEDPSDLLGSAPTAASVHYSPWGRFVVATPLLRRYLPVRGTIIVVRLSPEKDVADRGESIARWKRREVWTSAEAEISGGSLGREALPRRRRDHERASFPPHR